MSKANKIKEQFKGLGISQEEYATRIMKVLQDVETTFKVDVENAFVGGKTDLSRCMNMFLIQILDGKFNITKFVNLVNKYKDTRIVEFSSVVVINNKLYFFINIKVWKNKI